ncbi:7-carboxy-7-deazaguanine synthase QueE [Aquicella lusitana]|uniref:7-carboxy-7-deazaguanine synthase n=1 Tax=Aquicella lusitana TaxID=254246 RepID=A0A370GF47_9COXI|nr:7-carboxy-7-deazaguanine synthase QueE [Aquicella lusitana]RDI41816.1 7-carboxy-7-deazaguanine synthase [Aquicella lusitana]VVC73724.1 7-carboxy-7-deazaguanine synthase [Aquicella lusitana]
MDRLRISEIFFSLQGETRTVGLPTVFVRLTGCPLRCQYCDTAYAFQGGTWYNLEAILAEVRQYNARYVTVTGGEPLAQKPCLKLLQCLCDDGYEVSLETSGALDVSLVDPRVIKVVDIKTPGSGEVEKNNWQNIRSLLPHDQIKFVICNEADYEWAKSIIAQYDLNSVCQILFSPSYQQVLPGDLADWILRDRLAVRFQIQLHKYLWGDVAGR